MPPTTTLPRKAHAVILDMDGLMFDTEALLPGRRHRRRRRRWP